MLIISSRMALAADIMMYEVGHADKQRDGAAYMSMVPCNNTGGVGWGMMQ